MWIEGVGEGDNGYAWRPQQGGPACFAKVDQAKTTRRDCLGLWLALKASPSSWAARNRGTLSIHILCPTSPPRAFPWNVSIVLSFRLTSGLGTLLLIRPPSEADSIPGSVLPNPGRIFYVQIFAVLAHAITALPTSWMWNVKFRMYLVIYYPHSWWMQQFRMDSVFSA
jgi:hypothetical protein